MTKEEKQLLFKDLCERLPYGVICCVTHKKNGILVKEDMKLSGIFENGNFYFLDEMGSTYSDNYIPYLRPISSTTEEEKLEYEEYLNSREGRLIGFRKRTIWMVDWLYAHQFDYRGLIEKGLALEAPEGMYNNNKD